MHKLGAVIERIGKLDEEAMGEARKRLDSLTKPVGSLGLMEEIVVRLGGITGNAKPRVENKVIILMAGDHGVTEEGVSAYPSEVTGQMMANFLGGGAAINVLASQAGAELILVDAGTRSRIESRESRVENCAFVERKIALGTANMTVGPAMTREQALRSVEMGIEVVEDRLRKGPIDLLGTGDMGIGNTTPSSAICAVMTGTAAAEVTGAGTGISEEAVGHKVGVIERAVSVNRPDPDDGIDVLSKVGGYEIGGLVGVILAGAARRVPIVIDGFISGAAALIAASLSAAAKGCLIASHRSQERGHQVMLDKLGLQPVLDLNLRLGEGTGAALAMMIIEGACRVQREMATFDEAAVTGRLKTED